jgi:hypothetical protein
MDFNILHVSSTVPKRGYVINLDKNFLICLFQTQLRVCKYLRSFWATNSILHNRRTQITCGEGKMDKTGTKLEAPPRKLLVQNAIT